jgi:hypothetical protein
MAWEAYRSQVLEKLLSLYDVSLSVRLRDALSTLPDPCPTFLLRRDLLLFQRRKDVSKELQDGVLLSLLGQRQRTPGDIESFEILLSALIPIVESLYFHRKRLAETDGVADAGFGARSGSWTDETWGVVMAAFTSTIGTYPLQRRPRKVAKNILFLMLRCLADEDKAGEKSRKTEGKFGREFRRLSKAARLANNGASGLFEYVPQGKEPAAPPTKDELRDFRQLLRRLVPDRVNRTIVFGILAKERSFAFLSRSLGIDESNVRRRYERTLDHLREIVSIRSAGSIQLIPSARSPTEKEK